MDRADKISIGAHLPRGTAKRRRLSTIVLRLGMVLVLLSGPASAAKPQSIPESAPIDVAQASLGTGPTSSTITLCAEGAVNGFITISIASVTAMFSQLVLPAYPVLLGVGLGVGCTARLVGEAVKARGYDLWEAYGPQLYP